MNSRFTKIASNVNVIAAPGIYDEALFGSACLAAYLTTSERAISLDAVIKDCCRCHVEHTAIWGHPEQRKKQNTVD